MSKQDRAALHAELLDLMGKVELDDDAVHACRASIGGHALVLLAPRAQSALYDDIRARDYFRALKDGRLAYRLAYAATPATGIWPQVHIHESLNETILIFERVS